MIFVALYKLESSATTDLFEKWIFLKKEFINQAVKKILCTTFFDVTYVHYVNTTARCGLKKLSYFICDLMCDDSLL